MREFTDDNGDWPEGSTPMTLCSRQMVYDFWKNEFSQVKIHSKSNKSSMSFSILFSVRFFIDLCGFWEARWDRKSSQDRSKIDPNTTCRKEGILGPNFGLFSSIPESKLVQKIDPKSTPKNDAKKLRKLRFLELKEIKHSRDVLR